MPHVLANDLRDAVLQAAFEGKLTNTSAADSNTSILLKTLGIDAVDEEAPFDIPETWQWVKFGEISTYTKSKKKINAQNADPNTWMLDMEDIEKGGRLLCKKKVSERKAIGDKTVFCKGNILYSKLRPYLLKILIADDDGICTPELVPFDMLGNTNARYAMYYLRSPYVNHEVNKASYGVKMPRVGTDTMKNLLFPLPPIEEQARVVARLDEMMAKIDEYEKIENELTTLHKKFPADMKAAILQAAMQGKLTEQLANDENVNEYYSNIQAHRTQLIKEKVLKKENCLKEPIKDIPFDIPETWMWCHLGDCIQLISGADLTPDEYNDKQHGIVYLTGASNIENGRIIINRWTETPRNIAKKGDLLLTCKGTVGKTCFLKIDEVHIARQIMAIRAIDINPQYMAAFITYYVGKLQSMAKSMIPGIERANVLTAVFPLPPIEEQQRIVEKLDQLLPLCDQLEQMAA